MDRSIKSAEQKLLVINFGGIGDEILFLPTLKSLRLELPHRHLTLLLEPRARCVSELTDLVDEFVSFDIKRRPLMVADLLTLIGLLKAGNYQTVISSGSSPLVAILLFLSGIPRRVGYDSGFLSRRFLTNAVRLNRNQYAADMYHDLVQGVGLTARPVVPELRAARTNLAAMEQFLKEAEAKANLKERTRLIVHPGTSLLALQKGLIKTWKAGNWATLIKLLASQSNLAVILVGGPDDAAIIAEIRECLLSQSDSAAFISAYGVTKSLADLAAIIQLSDLLICVDSAPMHIAVGLSKPLVALFGPTEHGKLLPPDPKFKALVEDDPNDGKHFQVAITNAPLGHRANRFSGRSEAGVALSAQAVYQAVLAHIKKVISPKRSQEGSL